MSRIRVKHGEHEIEVEGADSFVEAQLQSFYDRVSELDGQSRALRAAPIKHQLLEPSSKAPPSKPPTPAEFLKRRNKKDGLSQLLIFAKYIEEHEGKTEFGAADINRVAKEARLSKDIHPQYFTNGVKQGYLRKHGKNYSLTLSAEEVLASM